MGDEMSMRNTINLKIVLLLLCAIGLTGSALSAPRAEAEEVLKLNNLRAQENQVSKEHEIASIKAKKLENELASAQSSFLRSTFEKLKPTAYKLETKTAKAKETASTAKEKLDAIQLEKFQTERRLEAGVRKTSPMSMEEYKTMLSLEEKARAEVLSPGEQKILDGLKALPAPTLTSEQTERVVKALPSRPKEGDMPPKGLPPRLSKALPSTPPRRSSVEEEQSSQSKTTPSLFQPEEGPVQQKKEEVEVEPKAVKSAFSVEETESRPERPTASKETEIRQKSDVGRSSAKSLLSAVENTEPMIKKGGQKQPATKEQLERGAKLKAEREAKIAVKAQPSSEQQPKKTALPTQPSDVMAQIRGGTKLKPVAERISEEKPVKEGSVLESALIGALEKRRGAIADEHKEEAVDTVVKRLKNEDSASIAWELGSIEDKAHREEIIKALAGDDLAKEKSIREELNKL